MSKLRLMGLVLLAACAGTSEYAQQDAYHQYLDRKARCRGIWYTEWEQATAHRRHPVELRMARCIY